jgi:hypothetical protein
MSGVRETISRRDRRSFKGDVGERMCIGASTGVAISAATGAPLAKRYAADKPKLPGKRRVQDLWTTGR